MLINETHLSFSQANAQQKGTARRCIDNSVTGRNRCTGYCNYSGHPGFLTEGLSAVRNCEKKNCVYYAPRTDRGVFCCPNLSPEAELLALAEEKTAKLEGLRLLRCEYKAGVYTILYATVAAYDLSQLAAQLTKESGLPLRFSPLTCDFETARQLIFGR